jgi:hypothetical protein
MDTHQIVAALIAERNKLTAAIEILQGATKRRGRPPGSKNAVSISAPADNPTPTTPSAAPKKRRRRIFTAAQRKAQGDRMRKMWMERRKKKG